MVETAEVLGAFNMRPPSLDELGKGPSQFDLQELFELKYRMPYGLGWGPNLRQQFGYYLPDDYYEAIVANVVYEGCSWADVGCGRDIFPSNKKLAAQLAKKAGYVFGIDPDDNVMENPFLTERFHGLVEDCPTDRKFNVITMRMVAEHIENPKEAVSRLAALTAENAMVIVFTPNKWSPMSIVAKVVPFTLHNPLKRLIWNSQERDTFPVAYKLNTRRELEKHFHECGFRTIFFALLDDCTVTGRYETLNQFELRVRHLFCKMGLPYLENCLLAVFQMA